MGEDMSTLRWVEIASRPTSEQRAQMAAYIDAKQPGLLDELGIERSTVCPGCEGGPQWGHAWNCPELP
jgi:hypothetical protein